MKYNRQSIRLKDYDYKSKGTYFITICVKNREPLLGTIIKNEMHLNNTGKIIEKSLYNIKSKFKYFDIDIYQIMPNHIHFILSIKDKTVYTIGDMIRYFKGRTSSKTNIHWQRNYYEYIIRNKNEYINIYNYIKNNPMNWREI